MSELFNLYEIAAKHSRLKPELNQFLLIDLAGCPLVAEKIVHAKLSWCGLLDSRYDNIPIALPIILSVVQRGNMQVSKAACTWLTECLINNSVASIISTPLAMMDLREKLELRTYARLSGNIEILLRFFDPRVFENLLSTLSKEQLQKFIAVSDAWSYVNRIGEVVDIQAMSVQSEDGFEPLRFSQKQEDKLIELATADNILYSLREFASAALNRIPLKEQYKSVSHAYALAVIDKIESMPAAVLYVATILVKGDTIRSNKYWDAFLDMLKTEKFLEASESISALLE